MPLVETVVRLFLGRLLYIVRMARQVVRKTSVFVLVTISLYGTVQLGSYYFRAAFGLPSAQWQLAFVLVPIPILLGVGAILIAAFPRPPLSRLIGVTAWVATLAPVLLAALVELGIY